MICATRSRSLVVPHDSNINIHLVDKLCKLALLYEYYLKSI
jgi:hypothetical protein